jgi:hypothetical protein
MSRGYASGPPRALRRRGVRLDNIALSPASQLPFKEKWQRIANTLPTGDALVVVPEFDAPIRRSMSAVADQLTRCGHRVAAVTTNRFS